MLTPKGEINEEIFNLCVKTDFMEKEIVEAGLKTPEDCYEALKRHLPEISFEEFKNAVASLAGKVNDRAILRAYHFYGENMRVDNAVKALENNDFEAFKQIILESGRSSYMYNQNVYSPTDTAQQKISLALCLTEDIIGGSGAYRVHGGGFAGTIQAFVPNNLLDTYKSRMESVFGTGSCHVLIIRPVGGTRVM